MRNSRVLVVIIFVAVMVTVFWVAFYPLSSPYFLRIFPYLSLAIFYYILFGTLFWRSYKAKSVIGLAFFGLFLLTPPTLGFLNWRDRACSEYAHVCRRVEVEFHKSVSKDDVVSLLKTLGLKISGGFPESIIYLVVDDTSSLAENVMRDAVTAGTRAGLFIRCDDFKITESSINGKCYFDNFDTMSIEIDAFLVPYETKGLKEDLRFERKTLKVKVPTNTEEKWVEYFRTLEIVKRAGRVSLPPPPPAF